MCVCAERDTERVSEVSNVFSCVRDGSITLYFNSFFHKRDREIDFVYIERVCVPEEVHMFVCVRRERYRARIRSVERF